MPGPPLGRRLASTLVALALCTLPASAAWVAATVLVAPALMAAAQAERFWLMLGLSSLVNGVAPAVALGVAWGLAGGASTGLLCGAAGWVVASLAPMVLVSSLSLPLALPGLVAMAPYVAAPVGASGLGGFLTARRPLPEPAGWRPASAVETGAVGGAASHLASGWTLVVAMAYGEPRGEAVAVAGWVALAVAAGGLAGAVAAWAGAWMARLGRHHP